MPTSTARHITATEVRSQFIDFFIQRANHRFIPSSPVVPHDDPTLLFTNAGMNQFKPIFLGQVAPGSPFDGLTRAVNTQKCIRAGGKHNDLDDVGKDTYHHTFFEMLGNWSFGDYFKAEAIQWAWELLTDIWGLDKSRLHATYFEGNAELGVPPDREAFDLWRRYLPPERIIPGGMKDNFWEMGDTGPCGPCSELHYDGRPDDQRRATPGHSLVNADNPDVIEIWNLVFIQFNRTGPTTLEPLPAKHVDTGMGFERIVRVIQGKTSNYDTDVFAPLFAAIKRTCNAPDYTGSLTKPEDIAYRVLADHARTLTFAVTDGAEPSNEGRGYVLRRILRRAVRYGRQTLGVPGVFLCDLVPTVVESFGEAFPELRKDPRRIMDIIRDEEEAFGRTLDQGIRLFEFAEVRAKRSLQQYLDKEHRINVPSFAPKGGEAVDVTHLPPNSQNQAKIRNQTPPLISAADAFKLHDTYGFPIDLTQLMAEERGLTVDVDGFHRLMDEARERSRAGGDEAESSLLLPGSAVASLKRLNVKPTDDADKFSGKRTRARILAIWNGTDFDENVKAANTRPTDRFAVILDKTPFYAEMGGQVADSGRLDVVRGANNNTDFLVESVRNCAGYIIHVGRISKGEIRVGDEIEARIDQVRRKSIAANHTATHLLNLALREEFGRGVDQRGSLVAPDRLRFDFSLNAPVEGERAAAVEQRVRSAITANLEVSAKPVPLEQGRAINGLRAVFGETYPDPVRIVSIGAPVDALLADPASDKWPHLSIEFCGGTHLERTGDAGAFAIISEEAVSKGVRRITALTGVAAQDALAAAGKLESRIRGAAALDPRYLTDEAKEIERELEQGVMPVAERHRLRAALAPLQEKVRSFQKQAAGEGRQRAVDAARELAASAAGPVVVGLIEGGSDRAAVLAALDAVRAKHADAAILLVSPDPEAGKVTIVANVPQPIIDKGLKAGDWVREASAAVGGKGGGRPDAAQGGGTEPAKAPQAVSAARAFASSKLGI